MTADADFETFARATVASAGRLYADDPAVAEQVRGAWEQVGVLTASGSTPADGLPEAGPGPSSDDGPSPDTEPQPYPDARPQPYPDTYPETGSRPRGGTGQVPPMAGDPGAEVLSVRRSGGYAGTVRFGELSLDSDPYGSELRRLLDHVSVNGVPPSSGQPDRLVYTVACRSWELTVPEQDLTPELSRVVEIVLDQGRLR